MQAGDDPETRIRIFIETGVAHLVDELERTPKIVEGDDCGCEHPKSNKAGRVGLWLATALILAILAFPNLIALLA